MESALVLFNQLLIMFIYIFIGWLMRKKALISSESSKALANLLLYCILPCVIIKSFAIEATQEKTIALACSFALGAFSLLIAVVVSALLYHKSPVDNFGSAFSNAGFMGIPVISAVLGVEAVFYLGGMVAMLNTLQWTYGQYLISGKKDSITIKGIIFNPLVMALFAGLLLYFLPISLPAQFMTCVNALAACNAPVAMVILGVYLGNVHLSHIFLSKANYLQAAVRLLLIPALTVLLFVPLTSLPITMRQAILIAASAPVGSNVAVYAQKQGMDTTHAVETVCLSTLLSVITMPLILLLAGLIW